MYSDHPSSSPVPSRESSPSTTPVDTPESSPAALDSDEPSSAADPLLGGSCDGDSCELAHMGKGKDDTSLGSADEVEHLEVAPIHHGAAVWESRDTYGPTGFRGLLATPFVTLCATFTAIGGLLFGYDQGVVSVILVMPQFLARVGRIADGAPSSGFWKGLLTAMIELGAFLGALNQGWLADKISRKYSIVVAVIIFTIGSALQTGAVDYAMLTTARFIGGVGIGMLSMVAPLYISEISPPEIRGTLLVLEEFSIVTGIVVAYWITYGTQYMNGEWSWRLPFLLQMIPGLVLGVGIVFLPFSPRWLVKKGRNAEALRALCKIRQLSQEDKRIQAEFFDIKAEARTQKLAQKERHRRLFKEGEDEVTGSWRKIQLELAEWVDLFRKNCWRRTQAAAGVFFFQQFVGINALIYYSPTLFKTMGLDHSMQLILSGVLNVTQLVGVASSIFTMDWLGRKTLLLWGSFFMFIAHAIIAGLVGAYSGDWSAHKAEGWVSAGFLFFYMLSFGASWGPVPWAYPAEIFPSSLRGKGVALGTATNWLMNFIIGLITPPLVQNTNYGAYIFFAVFCLLSLLWTMWGVKETKGRTLEQMDHVFGDSGGEEDKRRRETAENELATEGALRDA